MESVRFKEIIERAEKSEKPIIEFIRRAITSGNRLGVFAASFNPVTTAHLDLMNYSSSQFSLDEMLAIAGPSNADKRNYACSLEDRLEMLLLAFESNPHVSIGISSHAYFVDMIDAIKPLFPPETELYFILGFDTFERLLDCADHYTARYYRKFTDRFEALDFLFSHSRLIVAGRAGAGRESIETLVENEIPSYRDRVSFLDTPEDMGERSATEVRDRVQAGLSVSGLVPDAVERYVIDREIYRTGNRE